MKRLKSVTSPLFLLLIAVALAVPIAFTLAQDEPTDGEYAIQNQQIDSGSGEMTDGEYTVFGTAGIPYAGEAMTDGQYTVEPIVHTPPPPANAYIRLSAIVFEFGDNWQGVSKRPISNMYVEVYDESCPDVAGYGNWSWKADLRADYFNAVRTNCSPPINTGVTGPNGEAEIGVYVVPGRHVVIAFYEKVIDGQLYQLHLAKRVQIDTPGSTAEVKLGAMIYTSRFVSKRRVLPLMGTTVYGSQLDIYEPEYIVWEPGQTQEDFPFVEESAQTWQVDTSLYPPEGYVPDETSKSTHVEGTTETTVFQVTEVGSVMDATRVDYDIKELKDGKVIKQHRFSHTIGTKSSGVSEKFAKPVPKGKREVAPAVEKRPETIKLHEVFAGEKEGKPNKPTE
ncbi:hypothetical protein HZA56_02835 [Candidatus Poribacteria bacterium]|nr:hypothetical protein [Candidatus Poribacteria bacterium]